MSEKKCTLIEVRELLDKDPEDVTEAVDIANRLYECLVEQELCYVVHDEYVQKINLFIFEKLGEYGIMVPPIILDKMYEVWKCVMSREGNLTLQ